MTNESIKKICKDGANFTEKMFKEEVKNRISKNKLLSNVFECGMKHAETEAEREAVFYAIFDMDKDLKELLKIYLFYNMR